MKKMQKFYQAQDILQYYWSSKNTLFDTLYIKVINFLVPHRVRVMGDGIYYTEVQNNSESKSFIA